MLFRMKGRATLNHSDQNTTHRFVFVVLMALVISLFTFAAGVGLHPVSAAVGDTATVTAGVLTVREGPGPGYAAVGKVVTDDVVTMLGRNSDSSFIKVRLADGVTVGWISTFYIIASSPVSALPVLADAQPWGLITAAVANVRSGPGLEFNVLTTIGQGTWVTVLGRNGASTWINILVGGAEGWVGRSTISLSVSLAGNLPIVDSPAAPTATSTPGTAPDGSGGGGTGATATPVPTTTPGDSTVPSATVNTGELNVRGGPGPGYPVITKVFDGDAILLLGRNTNSSWAYMTAPDGKKGWVSTFYIISNVPISSLPVLADFIPTGLITTGNANLRDAPSLTSNVISVLPLGTFVGVLGRTADNAWVKVSASGVEGWVGSATLSINVPFSSLPVVTN
jgi:uncharacterized protein YgiM (DUF1202 family)